MAASVPQQVIAFLRNNEPAAFCDDCIQKKVGLKNRRQVAPVTLTLSLFPNEFHRAEGDCSGCSSHVAKLVIKVAQVSLPVQAG